MKEKFTLAGPNELEDSFNEKSEIAGFWRGLWHGLIAPFAFLLSLFKEDVGLYEAHNNGNWYSCGFILGLMILFGGNGGTGKHIQMRRDNVRDG
jgi:hypothetical protein